MKRNDVVIKISESWTMYGRINRVLKDGYFEVIDCGKYFRRIHGDDLEVKNDYKGYWTGRDGYRFFNRMPSLRKLKQSASRYNKAVWKKHRGPDSHYWDMEPIEE